MIKIYYKNLHKQSTNIIFAIQMKKEHMAQDNKIQTALEMIESYDWYWRMADEWLYDSAKAGMRRFVTFVSTIEDESIRMALRGLWTLRYEEASSIISGRNINVSEQRNEYMAVLAA